MSATSKTPDPKLSRIDDENLSIEERDDLNLLSTHQKCHIALQEKVKNLYIVVISGAILLILLACTFLNVETQPKPSALIPILPYCPPPQVWDEVYRCPDLTLLKGEYKEAYVFIFCSRGDPEPDVYYDMMRANIYKIQTRAKTPRDIIILTCPFTSHSKFETLRRLGAIMVPVETLAIPQVIFRPPSIDSPTRLHAWKLIGWDRLLMMDSDVYFMDGWEDIWDEPESQIRYAPPENSSYTLDSIYLGVKVRDLYPFAFAACIDHFAIEENTLKDKFNSGVSLFTPSLLHYQLLIEAAYTPEHHFPELEQSVINYVYRGKEALPFGHLNVIYNFWVLRNPYDPKAKLIHVKLWEEIFDGIEVIRDDWYKMRVESKTNSLMVEPPHPSRELTTVLSERVLVTSTNTTLSLVMSQYGFDQSATLYVFVTSDLFDRPGVDRIEKETVGNKSLVYDKGSNMITFINLNSTVKYNIHYFARTPEGGQTDVYHIQYVTK